MTTAADLTETLDGLLARLDEPDPDKDAIRAAIWGIITPENYPQARAFLNRYHDKLVAELEDAQLHRSETMARLAALCLLVYAPKVEQPTPNYRLARGTGPASEIALAALWILKHADEVVPLDLGDGPLEEADDPDFGNYRRVYASAVSNLAGASYFLLDAVDSRPALLSSPPEQETFPPLPFPRVWVEMSHLTPLLRMDGSETGDLDILGLLVCEVEQGRVWDIYLPFQYEADDTFFILAGRIAPERSIALDPSFDYGPLTFAAIRQLAVGVIHLITARNAPPRDPGMPRGQKKRLAREGRGGVGSRLYYVDLHSAGESAGAGDGQSGREYHVRWLVRGHWRHVDGGRSFCTCCDPPQIATWVAPYIKGPVGAPWKGKQIHRPKEST